MPITCTCTCTHVLEHMYMYISTHSGTCTYTHPHQRNMKLLRGIQYGSVCPGTETKGIGQTDKGERRVSSFMSNIYAIVGSTCRYKNVVFVIMQVHVYSTYEGSLLANTQTQTHTWCPRQCSVLLGY